MWCNIKTTLSGLLVISVLTVSGAGCAGQAPGQAPGDNTEPFVTDRVVTIRIVMTEDDWASCRANAAAEQYVQADFWFDGELVPDVAVRPKGNSSLRAAISSGSPRFSLKVDFNFFNSSRTFRGLKKLNFNNGFSDPTLIRECLAYELFEQMGIPTPRTAFVDLWVNDTHLGVYTMVEQIDQTFLSRHFTRSEGNLYKPEMTAAYLNWTEEDLEELRAKFGTTGQNGADNNLDINLGGGKLGEIMRALEQQEEPSTDEGVVPGLPGMPQQGMPQAQRGDYLKMMELKTNENYPDHSALFHFLDILNNEPEETFPEEIEGVLDVDEVLRFLAVSTLIVHLDNYIGLGHNYYLYEVDGKFTIIPWDLNMAFGTFDCGIEREGLINFLIDEPTAGPIVERPLVHRLLSHQPYLDTYHKYLEELLEVSFSVDVMDARINELAGLIRPYVVSDELKFYSTKDFERCLNEDVRRSGMTGSQPTDTTQLLPAPPISQESLSCLKRKLGAATLEELRTRKPTAEELQRLRSCLTREEMSVFLQFLQDVFRIAQQQLKEPQSGPSAIGLKAFVVERSTSVRQQLAGERASAGDGSGNGSDMRMFGGGVDIKQDAMRNTPGKKP